MPRQILPNLFVIQPPADFVEKHPELRRLSHTLSIHFAGGIQKKEGMTVVVTEEALVVMGRALWEALAIQDAFDSAHQEARAAILPIIIETDQPDEQALPWETLHHPKLGFLGKHPGFPSPAAWERRRGRRQSPKRDPCASCCSRPCPMMWTRSMAA